MLENLAKRMEMSGRLMLFANWKGPMRDFLDRAHFYDVVPPEYCFLSLMDSVQWAQEFYLAKDRGKLVKKGSNPKLGESSLALAVTEGSTGNLVDQPIGASYIPSVSSFFWGSFS